MNCATGHIERRNMDVVIPSASDLRTLQRTLPSVVRAARTASIGPAQIMVCDDAPEPRMDVRELVTRLGCSYLATRASGSAGARNAGASAGAAPVIVFVDDDVVLDPRAMQVLDREIRRTGTTAVVGGLRPPSGAPRWLHVTYETATLTPASAAAGDGDLAPVDLASALMAVHRSAFERAGGFPRVPGIEDSLLGLALGRALGAECRLLRRVAASGVHLYTPDWSAWLTRSFETGRLARQVAAEIGGRDGQALGAAHGFAGWRGIPRVSLGYLPARIVGAVPGRFGRRLAAAAAHARGWRAGASA